MLNWTWLEKHVMCMYSAPWVTCCCVGLTLCSYQVFSSYLSTHAVYGNTYILTFYSMDWYAEQCSHSITMSSTCLFRVMTKEPRLSRPLACEYSCLWNRAPFLQVTVQRAHVQSLTRLAYLRMQHLHRFLSTEFCLNYWSSTVPPN